MIELKSFTKQYGDFTAVEDLNLHIKKGEMFGIERFEQNLLNNRALESPFEEICRSLAAFRGDLPQNDDISLMEVTYDKEHLCDLHWKIGGKRSKVSSNWKMALELDPLSLLTRQTVAEGFYHAREFERSIAEWRNILELDPGFDRARWLLRQSYQMLGRFEEAIETYAERRLRVDSSATTLANIEELRRAYASRGPRGYWEWELEHTDFPGSRRTGALAALRRVDELTTLLERWYEERHGSMPFLRSPQYDPVRDHPRFQAMLRKMGLE